MTKKVILPESKCCKNDFARNTILLFKNNKAEFNLDIILTKEVILPERNCYNDDFARNRILLFKK